MDILLLILQLLQLPQSLAFASVCKTWRAAAITAGVPRSRTPWILSWAHLNKRLAQGDCSSAVTCNMYHLLDGNKAYGVSFPRSCFTACCGASHGWLVLVNELSNLVLYNPFTTSILPLPPITDFSCVEAVYHSGGSLKGYHFEGCERVYGSNELGEWFYQKAVLSCSPSKGGDYIVMIIHRDADWLSFVKAGQRNWQVASTLASKEDRYADCAYHDDRFYTITFHGMVEKWFIDGSNGPTREVVVAARRHVGLILTRHLVPTQWGDLLQVCAIRSDGYPDGIRFQIRKVDLDGYKKFSYEDLMDHALLLGLNHSACLHTKDFPGLRAKCIYFSVPWMVKTSETIRGGSTWGGVRIYDFKCKKFQCALPICYGKGLINFLPTEVWITPNL
jgi:hypothetical protein